jgi:hypothetical protein
VWLTLPKWPKSQFSDVRLEKIMTKLSLPALGCMSLLALGLSVATPAWAEDVPADETPAVDEGADPGVDPGTDVAVEDPSVTSDGGAEPDYDPQIAESGVGGPEVQRGGGEVDVMGGATSRTDNGRTGTGVITGKIIIKIAQ